MTIINIQSIKEYGTFIGLIEGFGYLYQVEGKLYKIHSDGLTQL